MDAFISICSGWFNVIKPVQTKAHQTKSKPTIILIHPFAPGERYLPIYCPFGCTYISSVSGKLDQVCTFETNGGTLTMQFNGLSSISHKDGWLSPIAARRPDVWDDSLSFNMGKKLLSRITKEKDVVRCKRGVLIGYIDSFTIDNIIISLHNAPFADMSDPSHYYESREMLGIWQGSQLYTSSLQLPIIRAEIPLSPTLERSDESLASSPPSPTLQLPSPTQKE